MNGFNRIALTALLALIVLTGQAAAIDAITSISLYSDHNPVEASDSTAGARLTVIATDASGNSQAIIPPYSENLTPSFQITPINGSARMWSNEIYGQRAGQVIVTALLSGFSSSITLTVTGTIPNYISLTSSSKTVLAGEGLQLNATVYDSFGNSVDTTVSWTTTLGSINSTGYFLSNSAGSAGITVRAGEATATYNLTVTERELDHLAFGSPLFTARAGQYYTFVAQAFDEYGNNVPTPALRYSVRQESGYADFTTTGILVGRKTGTVTFQAQAESDANLYATVLVTIIPDRPSKLEITTRNSKYKLYEGSGLSLTAEGTDQYGNPIGAISAQWSTSDSNVATITSDGVLHATNRGTVIVTATYDVATTSRSFTVLPSNSYYALVPPGTLDKPRPIYAPAVNVTAPSTFVANAFNTTNATAAAATVLGASGSTGLFSAQNAAWLGALLILIAVAIAISYGYGKEQAIQENPPPAPARPPTWKPTDGNNA
ncbi:hypothetical protein AUJ65_01660 [Candidatus Micrarchaeota archaeon CG1_02_51_15]|nr:MAG: hypothetical protein AUJ65_01660 [Candidatus Micrarchaeota archaeon CG1_02_51_15]